MKRQSDEFKAVAAVAKAYNSLPPIVDDDYPGMRFIYEREIRNLCAALKANRPGACK